MEGFLKVSGEPARLTVMGDELIVNTRNPEQDAVDLIQMMCQTLNTALLYGVTHKVTQSSFEITYSVISTFIEYYKNIHFNIAEGLLLVNGESTETCPLSISFTARLTGLNLYSFTIESGFSQNECVALYSFLLTPPSKLNAGKSPTEMMTELGLQHIEAKTFSYRRVSEDEPAGNSGAPAGVSAGSAGAVPDSVPTDLNNIMAFLKDDDSADHTRSVEDIRKLASNSEKLTELVLRAVEIRTSAANLPEGESLADLILGCIQKVVHPIIKDPALKTQKGRKYIKHSLLMLEKTLLERLRTLAGEQAAHAAEEMMDELVEDLDLDAIATQYMKNRRLAEKSAEKISRLIERASDDPEQLGELRERLTDQGLTPKGWQDLTVTLSPVPSKPSGGGGGSSGAGVNEIKILTLLLAQIGETIQTPPTAGAPVEIQPLINETEQHLVALAEITDKKIESLQSMLAPDAADSVLSRREILEILAEIAQEITQPLTIITGTTAMIRSLRSGPLTELQGELLSMIAESATRMHVLIDHLAHLSGPAKTRQPDRAILDAAYQKL